MSKSPLNHNPFGSMGKQIRIGKNKNSQANQFQGALGKIKSLAQNDGAQDPLGLLPDQSITSQAANIAGSNQGITGQAANIAGNMMSKKSNQGIASSAVSAVAQQAQQAQVAQGTGLNTLTQGPSASSTTEALNAGDYRPMGIGQAFLMKSPLKALDGSQTAYNYENPDQSHQTMSTGTEYISNALQGLGETITDAGIKKAKANKEKEELDKKLKNTHIGRPYSNKEEDKEKKYYPESINWNDLDKNEPKPRTKK